MSLKDIADRVGVQPPALLHYFDTKEELFTEILGRRDARDEISPSADSMSEAREEYLRILRHNAESPGIIELYSRLMVDAADPDHPAHPYFAARNAMLLQSASEFTDAHDGVLAGMPLSVDMTARIVLAVTDGLQLQWLIDPRLDMVTIVDALLGVLVPALSDASPEDPAA